MPSGAKKRKAAKRKKEQEQQQLLGAHPSGSPPSRNMDPPDSPQGNGLREEEEEDLMRHDSKGSESGSDFSSHMAQDDYQRPVEVDDEDEQAEALVEAIGEEKVKKESDSNGFVDVVEVMDNVQAGGQEQATEYLPPQKTEEDARQTVEVHFAAVEVKKDEILPPPLFVITLPAEPPVSETEAVTVGHVQFENGEDACVLGDGSSSVERREVEAVDKWSIPISEEAEQSRNFGVEITKVDENVAEAPANKIEERVLHLSDGTTEETNHILESHNGSKSHETGRTAEIHTKKRNRLEHKRLNDLVFVQYNWRLKEMFKERRMKPEKYDPICFDELDWGSEWMTGRALEDDIVHNSDDLRWADVDVAIGASNILDGLDRPRRTRILKSGTNSAISQSSLVSTENLNENEDEDEDDEELMLNVEDDVESGEDSSEEDDDDVIDTSERACGDPVAGASLDEDMGFGIKI